MNTKHQAFTLAEVLITLGIIGVVAAMTLPTLMANHRKNETVTKLKKFYSVVNQAVVMSVAEYGEVSGWGDDCGHSNNITCTSDEAIEWFDTYIGKHLQILKKEIKEDSSGFYVYFKDGSILFVPNYIQDMMFYTNKEAIKNEQSGRNMFYFRFNPVLKDGQTMDKNRYTVKSTIEPYAWNWDGTRDGLLHSTNGYGCADTRHAYCAKLIQIDGWEIKDDYPIKL